MFVVTLTALLFFITDGVCLFKKIFQQIFSKDIYLAQKATSALRLVIEYFFLTQKSYHILLHMQDGYMDDLSMKHCLFP